ncbi:hypothetical protein F5B17DRAFT_387612 [Nemania serpens]|nr:hypothetical protein F5B17DRAFT_387612 [Nemania serpens]
MPSKMAKMAPPAIPPKNAPGSRARKMYRLFGFSKGYNFVLWFIFVGALFGFALARLQYLDFWGVFCNPERRGPNGAMPGECFYYTKPGRYQIGIRLHLATVVPGSLLACFQFVPVLRRKYMLVHRINGYLVTVLSVVGTVAAIMIARRAAGGGADVQSLVGVLAIAFVGSLVMGIINIKKLQIEQHRAWMIRAWAYGAVIITTRLLMFIGTVAVSSIGGYYLTQPCDKINFTIGAKDTMALYPQCATFFSGENLDQHAVVKANYFGGKLMEIATALNISFGPAAWMALAIHAFAAELYLRLTPAEHERLRNVSYSRQLKAGMKNPGNAGLTVERYGDAANWVPKSAANKANDGAESSTKE